MKYYTCCPEPFPEIVITFHIRRKTLYYMYNIVFPCMMMSTLTVLVFCLPPDSGEKIALGVTVLLAFSVFMLAIAEKMPETSESIPLIGKKYDGFPICTLFASLPLPCPACFASSNFGPNRPKESRCKWLLIKLVRVTARSGGTEIAFAIRKILPIKSGR